MAHTKRIAIEGKLYLSNNRQCAQTFNIVSNCEDVIGNKEIEWQERFLNGDASKESRNFVNYIQGRELGHQKLQRLNISQEHGTRLSLSYNLLKEKEFKLECLNKVRSKLTSDKVNKVFCSTWLNESHILFGTKCNKLIVLDVNSKKMVQIPCLKSSRFSIPPENPCGIHALQMNPSKTLIATGALNSNDIAIYKLPTLDPVLVGEGAHKDWVFDVTWLDDEFLVSGSRDTTMALWRLQPDSYSPNTNVSSKVGQSSSTSDSSLPKYQSMQPLAVKVCKNAEKVRALIFNSNYQELIALSLNAYVHLWDAQTFEYKFPRKLPFPSENVCLAQQSDGSLYAVGSRSNISLLENRSLCPLLKISSKYQSCGIRSLSFAGELLTIGTGVGVVLFYDIRAQKYLDQVNCINDQDAGKTSAKRKRDSMSSQQVMLKATKGFVYREADEQFPECFFNWYSPAIYTHCYDGSGTRLFAAGGPLPASLQGNYAGLFL